MFGLAGVELMSSQSLTIKPQPFSVNHTIFEYLQIKSALLLTGKVSLHQDK